MTLPEQGGFNERLDEILQVMFNSTRPNVALPKAKAAIRTLIAEEIIGEDDDVYMKINPASDEDLLIVLGENANNRLRADQRKKLGLTANKEDGGDNAK